MTENSSSAVGRAAIDAYLDSVEQALTGRARAAQRSPASPPGSRVADRRHAGPTADAADRRIGPLRPRQTGAAAAILPPLTATAMNPLLPPTQVDSRGCREHIAGRSSRPSVVALLPTGGLLAMLCPRDAWSPLIVVISVAVRRLPVSPDRHMDGLKQLRAQPGEMPGRDLVLKSACAYGVLVPVLVDAFRRRDHRRLAFYLHWASRH